MKTEPQREGVRASERERETDSSLDLPTSRLTLIRHSSRRSASIVVVFALMANGQYRDGRGAVYFEERDVTRRAEGNQELPQEGVVRHRLPAGKRRQPKPLGAGAARFQSALRASTLRATESSMNADSVSPSARTDSAARRNSGVTRRAAASWFSYRTPLLHRKCNASYQARRRSERP